MNHSEVPEVSVTQVEELLQTGAALLDVREPSEWEAGHAAAAHHLPMGKLTLDDLPPGRPLLVVCHLGGRSAAATQALVQAGVEAVNVGGGMSAWQRAGMPVVTDSGELGRIV
jgi:rhodanese-related sulfurtransferase